LPLFSERDPNYDLVEVNAYGSQAAACLAAEALSKAGIEAIVPAPVSADLAFRAPVLVPLCEFERSKALLADIDSALAVDVSDEELARQALAEAPPDDAVD